MDKNAIKLDNIKRGDTLYFNLTAYDDETEELITGLTDKLKCQARYGYNQELLFEMIIEEIGTGVYRFSTDYDTNLLVPNRQLMFDIEYLEFGVKKSSDTFYYDIVGDITQNEQ